MTAMAAHGIDRIQDSVGFLVLNQDGAIISCGGELENDEATAGKVTKLVHTAYNIPVTPDKKDAMKRLSVILDDMMYVITVSQHKIFVCKRPYNSREPVST